MYLFSCLYESAIGVASHSFRNFVYFGSFALFFFSLCYPEINPGVRHSVSFSSCSFSFICELSIFHNPLSLPRLGPAIVSLSSEFLDILIRGYTCV